MSESNAKMCAIIVIVCMALLTMGYGWGAYIYIAIMAYATFNTVLASAGVLNGIINPMDTIKEMKEDGWVRPSKMDRFFLQIIHGIMLYNIFIFGFVFTSGVFATILSIDVMGNFLRALKGDE